MNESFEIDDDDRTYVLGKLRGLAGAATAEKAMRCVVIPGAPVSKSRARYSRIRGSFYTPRDTAAAEDVVATLIRRAASGEPFQSPVAMVAVFYRPNHQRIDADNLMKLIMDAATKAHLWADDCHVTALASFIELDRARPRTIVAWCPTTSTMDRSERFSCHRCGRAFNRAGCAALKSPPKYCSRECRYADSRAAAVCPKCGVEFQRRHAGSKYCSVSCAQAPPRVRRPNAVQRPRSRCVKCGGPVSRREYTHCALCRAKGRKPGSKNRPKATAPVAQVAGLVGLASALPSESADAPSQETPTQALESA